MTGEEKRLPEASVGSECGSERGVMSRALGMYLELPRKVQLALLTLAVAAVARATGVDERLVRLVVGGAVEVPVVPESLEDELSDQEALDAR